MFDVPEDEVDPPPRIAVPIAEAEGWPSASRRVRPKTASRAGVVLIVIGAIGLLFWLFLLGLGYAIASSLSDASNGGDGLHIKSIGYVIIALPIGFCVVQMVSGAWVWRGAPWARVLGFAMSCLAVAVSAAALFEGAASVGRLVILLAPVVIYAVVNVWLVTALIDAETCLWCQRAR